ncbi:hypothetical protein CVT24_001604 [Panaeolus cyanescens]|uniref:Uncharacterized protein n=1 Tax=Panaeolus cyanescens TaxID=181874 RepID=A0A409YFE8_9AGAR|nr:hypothetical protein CVT24_001604 [Panaeolus cyanescens]
MKITKDQSEEASASNTEPRKFATLPKRVLRSMTKPAPDTGSSPALETHMNSLTLRSSRRKYPVTPIKRRKTTFLPGSASPSEQSPTSPTKASSDLRAPTTMIPNPPPGAPCTPPPAKRARTSRAAIPPGAPKKHGIGLNPHAERMQDSVEVEAEVEVEVDVLKMKTPKRSVRQSVRFDYHALKRKRGDDDDT